MVDGSHLLACSRSPNAERFSSTFRLTRGNRSVQCYSALLRIHNKSHRFAMTVGHEIPRASGALRVTAAAITAVSIRAIIPSPRQLGGALPRPCSGRWIDHGSCLTT